MAMPCGEISGDKLAACQQLVGQCNQQAEAACTQKIRRKRSQRRCLRRPDRYTRGTEYSLTFNKSRRAYPSYGACLRWAEHFSNTLDPDVILNRRTEAEKAVDHLKTELKKKNKTPELSDEMLRIIQLADDRQIKKSRYKVDLSLTNFNKYLRRNPNVNDKKIIYKDDFGLMIPVQTKDGVLLIKCQMNYRISYENDGTYINYIMYNMDKDKYTTYGGERLKLNIKDGEIGMTLDIIFAETKEGPVLLHIGMINNP